MTVDIRARLLEKVEEGVIDKDFLISRMVSYMCIYEIKDMLQCNEMLDTVIPPAISRNFYFDSGHGWLRVNYQELIDLGITKHITNWSYRDDKKVYLEEDIDAGTYIHAVKEQQGLEIETIRLDIRDNPRRNPQYRVDPRKLERFYLDYDEVMPLGGAENLVGWMDKYKSGENK